MRQEFEVVDNPQLIDNEDMKNFSTWNQEIEWHKKEAKYCPTTQSPRFTNGQLKPHVYYGICIFADVANPYFRGVRNRDGVPAKVSFLYNNRSGLIRAKETDLVDGKRYRFTFLCGNYKNPKEQRTSDYRKLVFESSKAIELSEVRPVLPTRLDPFEIMVSYPFSEDKDKLGFERVKPFFMEKKLEKFMLASLSDRKFFKELRTNGRLANCLRKELWRGS